MGKFFLLDDFVYAFLDGLRENDLSTAFKIAFDTTLDTFFSSWQNMGGHIDDWKGLISFYQDWFDEELGIDDFIGFHFDLNKTTEGRIDINISNQEVTFTIKSKNEKREEPDFGKAISDSISKKNEGKSGI